MIQDTKLLISLINYQIQKSNTGPCHGCNGPYLIEDCRGSVCKRCKPNLYNHGQARYSRKWSPNRQHWLNHSFNNYPTRNQSNSHSDPNLQLYISTSKPDHISELLEAIKKWLHTLKSQINITDHTILIMIIITPVQVIIAHFTQTDTHVSHVTLMTRLTK